MKKKLLPLLLCLIFIVGLLPITSLAVTTADDDILIDLIPSGSHIHTPSNWRITQVYHYTVCTACGDMLEQEDHKGGKATCAEPAVCSVCDYAYEQPHENHTPEDKWTARGDMYHMHKCKLCGAHCDIEDHRWGPKYDYKVDKGHAWICADCKAHSAVTPHTPGPEATETTPQTCRDCGYIIAPVKSSHIHTPSDWRITQAYHYTVCTTCGDMLEQEDHKGGKATCAEPAVCSVCDYAYEQPHENHTPEDKWTARGDMYHMHKCKLCGAHCDIEDHRWGSKYDYKVADGHARICADCKGHSAIKPHTPGPEATETTPQTCKDCGYIITPVKNHTHNLTAVKGKEPTCTEDGIKAHYVCNSCSKLFADEDGNSEITDVSLPALGHDMKDGKCARCSDAGKDTTVPGSTQPTTPEATQTPGATETEMTEPTVSGNTASSKDTLFYILIGVGVLLTAAITSAVTVIILKKKQ